MSLYLEKYYFVTITLACSLASPLWLGEICARMVKTVVTRKKKSSQQVSNILPMVIPSDPGSVIVQNAFERAG